MEELTRWFDLRKGEFPPCPGVYEVDSDVFVEGRSKGVGSVALFSYWDGKFFFYISGFDPQFAWDKRGWLGGGNYVDVWRGLAQDPARKLSRRTDPATSKEAAAKAVRSGIVKSQCQRILACLKKHGPQNANQVGARLRLHPHKVMKRFSDLKNDGFASPNGKVIDGQRVWNAI